MDVKVIGAPAEKMTETESKIAADPQAQPRGAGQGRFDNHRSVEPHRNSWFYVEVARITSTGLSECRTTVSVTLPSTQRLTPERP